MKISIIIPTYNEADRITELINCLKKNTSSYETEIIVVDSSSTDTTSELASRAGAQVIHSFKKSRARQMNAGVTEAHGEVLYFLHADSEISSQFLSDITVAIKKGVEAGCFRLHFDSSHWLLRLSAWFTRFYPASFHYGDQSLFITKELFEQVEGYNENLFLFEDYDIIKRIQQSGVFQVMNRSITTSARRYRENGVIRLQAIYAGFYILYKLGVSQKRLVKLYNTLIN